MPEGDHAFLGGGGTHPPGAPSVGLGTRESTSQTRSPGGPHTGSHHPCVSFFSPLDWAAVKTSEGTDQYERLSRLRPTEKGVTLLPRLPDPPDPLPRHLSDLQGLLLPGLEPLLLRKRGSLSPWQHTVPNICLTENYQTRCRIQARRRSASCHPGARRRAGAGNMLSLPFSAHQDDSGVGWTPLQAHLGH